MGDLYSQSSDPGIAESLTPWAAMIVLSLPIGYIFNGWDGVGTALMISPWIGLLLSILYMNYRFLGHPLRFSPRRSE